jgi:hypothetical protein
MLKTKAAESNSARIQRKGFRKLRKSITRDISSPIKSSGKANASRKAKTSIRRGCAAPYSELINILR